MIRTILRCSAVAWSTAMNPSRKYWREAATLIITSPLSNSSSPDSASLHQPTSSEANNDYGILLLQRSQKAKFMPGAYVFPGGTISDEDFSEEWRPLYEKITGRDFTDIRNDLRATGRHLPPIMGDETGSVISKEIGLRICAIRETFEESGVLLAVGKNDLECPSQSKEIPQSDKKTGGMRTHSNVCNSVPREALSRYQDLVRKDAGLFLTLCQDYEVVPDIWCLYEWSNWLTPVLQQVKEAPEKPRRFDTIFFICGLKGVPDLKLDNQEMIGSKWLEPQKYMANPSSLKVIRGPQPYEIAKMANFRSHNELLQFSRERARLGVERWMACVVLCEDGALLVLPGDDLYPDDPDLEGLREVVRIDRSRKDLEHETSCHHRWTVNGSSEFYTCNIKLNLDYPTPVVPAKSKPSRL